MNDAAFRRELAANHFMGERPALTAAPRIALPGLDDVSWDALRDAYGPAYFVPRFIEALSSPEAGDRDWGLGALHASINHQGRPDEASPVAVPFLLELLRSPALPDPAGVLALLTELAVGESRWCFEAGTELDRFHRTSCYEAVALGAGLFVERLTHAEAAVRAQAALACGLIEACATGAEALLRVLAVEEPEPGVRFTARIALGIVARRNRTEVASLLRRYVAAEDVWERASALAGLAYAIPTELELDERRALGQDVPPELEPPAHLLWDLTATLPAQHVTTSVPEGLEAKLARVEAGPDAVAAGCADRVLAELVPREHRGEAWLPGELAPELLRLLRAIATSEELYGRVLGHVLYVPPELPSAREHLRRWLGLESGPLDRTLVLENNQWPLWRVLHGVALGDVEATRCRTALATTFEPSATTELVEDALANLRWWSSLGRLRQLDYRDLNARISRVLILFGHLLSESEDGLAWAREQATVLRAGGGKQVTKELVVALALGAAARRQNAWLELEDEALLRLDQAPVTVYAAALTEAAKSLSPERAEAFVSALPLHTFSVTTETLRDPGTLAKVRVSSTFIRFLPFWELLPALAGPSAVRRVLEALLADQTHRAEQAAKPEPRRLRGRGDDDFPRELALETIARAGNAALHLLQSFRPRVAEPSLIDEALARLGQ